MIRILTGLILAIVLLFSGVWLGYHWSNWGQDAQQSSIEAAVVLEKIREVNKLATIEATFSEIMRHKSYYYFDIPMLRKQSIIHVSAKVLAGYDMEHACVDIDEAGRRIVLSGVMPPAILAIEPEVSYYDIQNGTFNAYSAADITWLQAEAVETIRRKALEAGILNRVAERSPLFETLVRALMEQSDWQLVWDDHHDPDDTKPVLSWRHTMIIPET